LGTTHTFTVSDPNATNSPQTGTVTANVYDHSAASFNNGTTQHTSLTINLSGVQGSGTVDSSPFSIFNLSGVRVNLKLTGIGSTLDPNNPTALSVDPIAVSGLSAGNSVGSLLAHLDTTNAGSFQNVYTLHFADDSGLTGAAAVSDLVLTVNGEVTAAAPEPMSVCVLGLGCVGLLVRRRRAM
jgi:hypothetical protein